MTSSWKASAAGANVRSRSRGCRNWSSARRCLERDQSYSAISPHLLEFRQRRKSNRVGGTDDAPSQAYCSTVTPGDGRLTLFSWLLNSKAQAIIESGKQGCADDLEKYCSTVAPGEGWLAFCLIAHGDKRSDKCERALGEARTEAEALIVDVNRSIEACAPDVAALCSGTEPGEGRLVQCLADQREVLSDACGQVMDTVGRIVFAPKNTASLGVAPQGAEFQITTGTVNPPPSTQAAEPSEQKLCRTVDASVRLGPGSDLARRPQTAQDTSDLVCRQARAQAVLRRDRQCRVLDESQPGGFGPLWLLYMPRENPGLLVLRTGNSRYRQEAGCANAA